MLAALFGDAISVAGPRHALMVLPLCLAIAIVHKAIHVEHFNHFVRSVAALWVTLVFGMYAVGIAAWLFFVVLA